MYDNLRKQKQFFTIIILLISLFVFFSVAYIYIYNLKYSKKFITYLLHIMISLMILFCRRAHKFNFIFTSIPVYLLIILRMNYFNFLSLWL
jgi:hypothetical protein